MKKSKDLDTILSIEFKNLMLSPRTLSILERNNIALMKELCILNKDELKTEKEGFGDNIIIELEQVMLDFGLNFGLKL